MSDKVLESWIYILKILWLKKNSLGYGQKISINISPKMIQKWSVSTWKNHSIIGQLGSAHHSYNEIHFVTTRMATINDRDNNKWWPGCGETETLIHCSKEYKTVQALWKTIWQIIKRLNIELAYDPAIPFLDIHPRELKTYT